MIQSFASMKRRSWPAPEWFKVPHGLNWPTPAANKPDRLTCVVWSNVPTSGARETIQLKRREKECMKNESRDIVDSLYVTNEEGNKTFEFYERLSARSNRLERLPDWCWNEIRLIRLLWLVHLHVHRCIFNRGHVSCAHTSSSWHRAMQKYNSLVVPFADG